MIDFSLYNKSAVDWALHNAGSTYGDITPKQQEAIKTAMAKIVRTPGFTVGDAMKILSKYFDEERADLIAITPDGNNVSQHNAVCIEMRAAFCFARYRHECNIQSGE